MDSPGACPRCATPIAGDYKFCPSCAYRLRGATGPLEAPTAPPRGRPVLLGVAVALLVAGALVAGAIFLRPDILTPTPAEKPEADPEWASYVTPALTVARMREDLVEVPQGFAYEVPLDVLPSDDPWPEVLADLRSRFPELTALQAWTWYPMKVLRYEVTRGQYDEFLRDVLARPDNLPRAWRREVEQGQHADDEAAVLAHVPAPWRVVHDGRTTGWALPDPDRNLPVTHVSFLDAQAFCEWASDRLGTPLRLPMALEWVRAARAGRESPKWVFPWGTEPLRYACNNEASFGTLLPVHFRYSEPGRTGGATPEGLYAMAGNVAEYALDHDLSPLVTGPVALLSAPPSLGWRPFAPGRAPATVMAYGGSFRSAITECRVDVYQRYAPTDASRDDVGFRVVSVED